MSFRSDEALGPTPGLFRAQALQAAQARLYGSALRLGGNTFARRRRPPTPVLLQAEAAECGLACLAMVAGHHGHRTDLASLRARHAISAQGATLGELMQIAGQLHLNPRPLRAEMPALEDLALPCVLHWDFNHFVVLTEVRPHALTVHDPAAGRRELSRQAFSEHFTGIALELTPTEGFTPRDDTRTLPIRALIGRAPWLTGRLMQVALLALLLQALVMLGPFYLQWVVDDALAGRDAALVGALGMGFALLALVQANVTGLRAWLLAALGTRLHLQMLANLFGHLLHLPMAWFDKRHLGDVLSRFESLRSIQRSLTTGFLEAMVDGAMVLLTLGLMFAYSARLALIGLLAAALYGALRLALHRPARAATEAHLACAAKQHGHFLESVRGVQTIKLFAQEDQRFAQWHNMAVDQANAAFRAERIALLHQALNAALFGIENVATVWAGALLILGGSGLTIGQLFAFVACKAMFTQRVSALVDKGMELRMLALHAERVADVALSAVEPRGVLPAASAPTTSVPASPGIAKAAASIELKHVSFRYGDGQPLVLDDLSLRIEAGESVAIVGASGCGKTTLLKLMLGLLEPAGGGIEVDGVPLAVTGPAGHRRGVASVMQEDQLFAGSIAENICFFDPQPDLAHLHACARLAAVHDDIAAMPMQWHTPVGDMGTVLSGGQKQRVLLARALYRRPRILFLDEATSHLDLARERQVNEAVGALALTRIIVAHRPETIASADRVIRLAGGRIVRHGHAHEGARRSAEP